MKRFFALALSFMMVFSVVSGSVSTAFALAWADANTDQALHFRVMHWHAVADPNATTSSDVPEGEESGDYRSANSVSRDGYIVPSDGTTGQKFHIFMYDDASAGYVELTDDFDTTLWPYVDEVKTDIGEITFKVVPYADENGTKTKELESLGGFSISAGHDAVTPDDNAETLTITYRPDVHLAKAHIFYIASGMMVDGAVDVDTVIGTDQQRFYPEQDTYDDVAADTKYYSAHLGLHTDKTASVSGKYGADRRTFDIELEAWYTNREGSSVALVLDASGSMAFTLDKPDMVDAKGALDAKLAGGDISQAQYDAVLGKALSKTSDGAVDWDSVFLTDEELSWILNPHNTDNSPLSSSGYSYYVYNARNTVMEYAPLAYMSGTLAGVNNDGFNTALPQKAHLVGFYPFTSGRRAMNSINNQYGQKVERLTGKPIAFRPTPIDMNVDGAVLKFGSLATDKARFIMKTSITEPASGSDSGFVLDVGRLDQFTITFKITQDGSEKTSDDRNANANIGDILYVGKLDGSGDYLKLYRRAGSSGNQIRAENSAGTTVLHANNVFKSDGKTYAHTVTLVYDGSEVTMYIDGAQSVDTNGIYSVSMDLEGAYFIFNGFDNGYAGAALSISDIYVYDTALQPGDVSKLSTLITGNVANGPFTDPGKDKNNNYIVLAGNGEPMGTIHQAFVSGSPMRPYKVPAGWYYVNPSSNWDTNYNNPNVQSGKVFWGTPTIPASTDGSHLYDDKIEMPGGNVIYIGDQSANYDYDGQNTAVRFFLDSDYNLCCFFATGNSAGTVAYTSYVYENPDENYIKVEALQRALGVFLSMLAEHSPASQIAATRFSTERIPDGGELVTAAGNDLDHLVLLDWTNDTKVSIALLSLLYGDGRTVDGTVGAFGKTQYNYGLTGGTATYTGLKAFLENLTDENTPGSDPYSKKYLIIFTDGKDSLFKDGENPTTTVAYKYAQELKKEGYTIIGVMLAGGPVVPKDQGGTGDFEKAESFMTSLVSTGVDPDDPTNTNYVYYFTTADYGKNANAVDGLTEIFSSKIIKLVTDHLYGYTIQDYIDPRFDLLDVDGNVWHLDAKGMVTVEKNGVKDTPFTLTADGVEIELTDDADVDTGKARLYYNDSVDMYYLRWTDQRVPATTIGSTRLPVWNTRFTIRAKEDFIGGYAVLTNGHEENMNFVFHPDDTVDVSSGTNGAWNDPDTITTGDLYPSKGFPRVTVNVEMLGPSYEDDQLIYMGETLDPLETTKHMIDQAIEKQDDGWWYWEYLKRYDENHPDEKVFEKLVLGTDHVVSIPYYYLPSKGLQNQAGIDQPSDPLGTMVYTWTSFKDGKDVTKEPLGSSVTEDTLPRQLTLTFEYTPYEVAGTGDGPYRQELLNDHGLINEHDANGGDVYLWNRDYKKEQGTLVNIKPSGQYVYSTVIVSGEIHLQVEISRGAMENLWGIMPGQEVEYRATLVRTYGNGKQETVGTIVVPFTVPETRPTSGGLITSKWSDMIFTDAYAYAAEYGLPYGTYTLVPDAAANGRYPFSFSEIIKVPLLGDGSQDALFDQRYGKQYGEDAPGATLLTFAAPYDASDKQPILGSIVNNKPDTDERYALLKVTLVVQEGNLTVSKTVEGAYADKTKSFAFTVRLSDTNINGTYGDMTFSNGVANFTLKHGESKTAIGLTAGVIYSVYEAEANQDGYATTNVGSRGTITANVESKAIFLNVKDQPDVPQTGDNSHLVLWIVLMAAAALGMAVIIVRSRKGMLDSSKGRKTR